MTTPTLSTRNLMWKVLLPVLVISALALGSLWWLKSQLPKGVRPMAGGGGHPELRLGSVLPDITLQRFGGGTERLSELRKKVVLVNFWASWCESCLIEMPSFVALRKKYHDQGFEVIAVNVDEQPESVLPRLIRQFGIDFPVYVDPEGKNAEIFDVHAIPLTVVLDKNRSVLLMESGQKDWNSPEFQLILERWLAGA